MAEQLREDVLFHPRAERSEIVFPQRETMHYNNEWARATEIE